MARVVTTTATLSLDDGSVNLAKGANSGKAVNQVSATGENNSGSVSPASGADSAVPMGGCTVSTGTTFVRVWIYNMDTTDSVIVKKSSGGAEVGRVRPGDTWGPCLVDYAPYVRSTANTPYCKTVVVQE